MSTKIFYNDNRIIIDGHADTAEECQAITAMCDEMANSDNFKTIVYEKGHAVFERIDGGDALMFADSYVTQSEFENYQEYMREDLQRYLSKNQAELDYMKKVAHEASIGLLQGYIDQINYKIGYPDIETYGTIGDQLTNLTYAINDLQLLAEKAIETAMKTDKRVDALEESAGDSEAITALDTRVSALETAPKEALPYTADEFSAMLTKLENL